MSLISATRAVSFSSPRIPVEELEGVDPAIAGIAQNSQSIQLPALDSLPAPLAEALRAYLAAAREAEAVRVDARGLSQVEAGKEIRKAQAVANAAWVDVLKVVHENRAEIHAQLSTDRAASFKRLHDAAAELRAAAIAHTETAVLEAGLAEGNVHSVSHAARSALPFRGVLHSVLYGSSSPDPDDGLEVAMALVTH